MHIRKFIFRPGRAIKVPAFILLVLTMLPVLPGLADASSFLWKLESPLGRTAYLAGSLHLAHPELYPLNETITGAFAEAGLLVVEINSEDMDPALMNRYIQENGFFPAGPPLLERLSPQTRRALDDSGLYETRFARMKPWLAALSIQVAEMHRLGFRAEYGLDKYFIDRAKERKIRILELESLEQQMGMLTHMSEAESDLFLLSTLLEMGQLPQVMQAFMSSWEKGDAAGFAEAFFREYEKYPQLKPLMDIIIFRRNREMAAKIEDLTAEETALPFIVVGAGHLVGPGSILDELSARGWKSEQL